MKLFISIGPDLLGVEYSSKKEAKRALNRAFAKKPRKGNQSHASLDYTFKNRKYNFTEFEEAHIMTPIELFKAYKV